MREASLHLRSRPLVLEVKKMAPDAEGAMRKIPEDVRAEEGRALARLGDGGWDPLVQAGRKAGRFDDELVAAAAEVVQGWGVARAGSPPSPRIAAASSSPASPARSPSGSGCAFAPVLERVPTARRSARWPTPTSRSPTSAAQLRVTAAPPPGPGLLVDDIRFSGWTLAMVAGQLRGKGAEAVYPLALSTAF